MRVLLACIVFAVFAGTRSLAAGLPAKGAQANPRTYVDLEKWAAANNLRFRFSKRDETVRLTNSTSKLEFKINSRRAKISEIDVWLSFPIAGRRGSAVISQFDLDTLIKPILFPSREKKPRTIKTVALCAGHGGRDPGNREGPHNEKTLALLLTKDVQQLLLSAGLKVVLTRATDKFVDLNERPAIAKRAAADLFIGLHYNSAGAGGADAQGVEVYCLTPAKASSTNSDGEIVMRSFAGNRHDARNVLLAFHVQKALVKSLDTEDRGMRRARFLVLRQAEMPAILIEAGFMSNARDLKKILDPKRRKQTAQAIVDGILAYKRLVER